MYASYIHKEYMCIALFVISRSDHGVRVMLISQYEVRNFSVISVQFSHSVMSDSLQWHGMQHARPPCPSPTPGVHQIHVHRVGDAIQPSHPMLSPSPPAPNPSQHQSLFQ